MNRTDRQGRLQAAISAAGLDAIVLTDLVNIGWLTGFSGSNATVLASADGLVIVTDGRYQTQISAELAQAGLEAEVIIDRDAENVLAPLLADLGRVGLEADRITWARQRRLAGAVGGGETSPGTGPELVATSALVADLRMVKDDSEIELLERAATIADQAVAEVVPLLNTGKTERWVAAALDDAIRRLGADGPAFDTIVASGPNSALPHATPSEREITDGDLVIIDVGARYRGYGSDMTRTFKIGPVSDQCHRMYEAVEAAQQAGVASVAAGVAQSEIDQACRRELATAGLEEAFIHGTGHGIGLEIHEIPFLSPRSDGILRSGSVITVEPGVYVEGVGGVRIEDSVLVTDDGCRPITTSPKDPQLDGT